MRRSGAPSQLANAAKRAKFQPPVSVSAGSCAGKDDKERSISDILKLVTKQQNSLSHVEASSAESQSSECTISSKSVNPDVNVNTEDTDRQLPTPAGKGSGSMSLPMKPIYNRFRAPLKVPTKINVKDATNLPIGQEGLQECSVTKSTIQDQNDVQDSEVQAKPNRFKAFAAPKFKAPQINTSSISQMQNMSPMPSGKSAVKENEGVSTCYYNVMWCKQSKKKHKTWEGDAILIVRGRNVSLVDMEGKEIGRGSGYKSSDVSSMVEGSSLLIGGKEIEVMSIMSEEHYKSGKCFHEAAGAIPSAPIPQRCQPASKAYVNPSKGGSTPLRTVQPAAIKPRFDPLAPGALVMPRPSGQHTWTTGANVIVDVVVDPYLSQHLRPHQKQGVIFLYQCIMGMRGYNGQGAILADEMGLGKTLQCITVIWTLLKQGPFNGKPALTKVVVITPGSLVKNWSKEFKKWLGDERLRVFAVTSENKVSDFLASPVYSVMVISYEMLIRCIDNVRAAKFDLIVCDEGHRLKNTGIKTTSMINSLESRKRIVLTGTPVQNDLQELFSIVDFCNPGILGTSAAFRHVYEGAIVSSRQPSASAEERMLGETRASELNRITGLFILRRTQDINNRYLPPKVECVLFCQPSPLQVALYKKLVTSRAVRQMLLSSDPAQHLVFISTLRKLCNHPVLIQANSSNKQNTLEDADDSKLDVELRQELRDTFEDYNSDCYDTAESGKLNTVDTLLSAMFAAVPRQRVVLVSNYTATLDVLANLCKTRGYEYLRLDGQTPTAKRQQLVERFNNAYGQDFVFLLSSKAGGVGLNLIGASRLILYDIDWNPANDLQAMARVWRDGQQQQVYIYRLLTTGTIEEKIYQRQITKQALSGVVVDAKQSNTKVSFSPEELRNLFKLEEGSLSCTHDLLECDCGGVESFKLEEKAINLRDCQLDLKGQKPDKKNVCMDELLDWHHVRGPNPDLSNVDPVIARHALGIVSFAFWSENNSAKDIDLE